MPAWLTESELDACLRAAADLTPEDLRAATADLEGEPDAEDFLYAVCQEGERRVNLTQPADDQSHFSISDLDEDDRKQLLEAGGYNTDDPEVLDVITAMPRHTIVSDGTAKRIAQKKALKLGANDSAAFKLFATTGAVVPALVDELAYLKGYATGREFDDLERLEWYLGADKVGKRGPQPGWDELTVPDWVDRSLAVSSAYLDSAGAEPAVEL
jgi:hypothetical protein